MSERTALRHDRAFVLLCGATAVRGIAFWLCWIGMLSLASFELRATPGQIALITAATSVPHILLSPFLGALVDRLHPKTTLVGAFTWNIGIGALLVAANRMWHLYAIAFAWSASGAVIWPALGSLLKQMTPEKDLLRANGIVHGMWEATLIVGPIASGLLSDHAGPRAPLAVGAAVSLLSVLVLLPIHVTVKRPPKPGRGRKLDELKQGLSLMLELKDLRAMALWGAVAWAGFNVLIAVEPVFVRDVLRGSSSMFGAMYSVGGIGSTIGAIAIGWFVFSRFELRTAATGMIMTGSLFAAYISIARWPHVLPIQAFIGMGFAIYQTSSQALVQRRASQHVVGRALSAKRQLEEVAGLGGSLAAAAFATTLGTRPTMIGAGALMTAAALALFYRSYKVPGPGPIESLAPAPALAMDQVSLGLDPAHDRAAAWGHGESSG